MSELTHTARCTFEVAPEFKMRVLSPEDGHYFFGYYEKSPYDATGRHVLAGRANFVDRMPGPEDPLTLGLLDAGSARAGSPRFTAVAQTQAWCWQQGTMLQWLPPNFDRQIIFNVRIDGRFASRVVDVQTGETRDLSRPVYAVDPLGRYALSLNFARLARTRPGYGYEGVDDPHRDDPCPANDGIWYVPLDGGSPFLIFSIRDATLLQPLGAHRDVEHWFNHIQINTNGSRAAFLHRWRHGSGNWRTRMITLNPDGSDARVLADSGFVSHYDWVDADSLVAWTGAPDPYYTLLHDSVGTAHHVGAGVLDCDGHMSISPNRRRMLSDTYPDSQHMRTLFLWTWPDGPRHTIGRFFSPPELDGPVRVDLHPRWRRDGRAVCIDSAHLGHRGLYELSNLE